MAQIALYKFLVAVITQKAMSSLLCLKGMSLSQFFSLGEYIDNITSMDKLGRTKTEKRRESLGDITLL